VSGALSLELPTYTCTTSAPATPPVLRTVTVTVSGTTPSVPAGLTVRSDSSNVVYERPNPNGNSGAIP